MISKEPDIVTREEINLKHRKELCEGIQKPAFFAEFTEAKADDWYQSVVDDWDNKVSSQIPTHQTLNLIEHQAAYALQRDVNHRYQQSIRLRAFGYHRKFRTHFFPFIHAFLLEEVKAEPLSPLEPEELEDVQ